MTTPPTPGAPGAGAPAGGLARLTVRGATWTIGSGLATRLLGVIGTLVITRFITPYDYGVVAAAVVVVSTANQISSLSVGSFILANRGAGRPVVFHATVLHVGLGFLAYGAALALGGRLGASFSAPDLGRFLPGMVLAMAIDRVTYMPERVLVRDMRFGQLSVARSAGEVAYTATSIATAVLGWGGMAIIAGNLARAGTRFVVTIFYVQWREWLEVTRLQWATFRAMVSYGFAIAVGSLAGFGMRRWDNLIVSRFFGPAVMGRYSLAYNLADIPAVQVGEEIADVLHAAFARTEGADGRRALLRSLGVLSFIMTPMAVGLGCVGPAIGTAFFRGPWQSVGSMLMVLAIISFTRPISGTVGGFLEIRFHQRLVALIDIATLGMLMAALWTVGRLSPLSACVAVGVVFAARMVIFGLALRMTDGVPLLDFLRPMLPPLLASAPLVGAVAGLHHIAGAFGAAHPTVLLIAEILAGAAGYAVGAMMFARSQTRELLTLLRSGLGRRFAPP
jgi:lipopolysaccharide exporter